MASNTLLRASSLIHGEPLITLETVPAEIPASFANSLCVYHWITSSVRPNSANAGPENETE
jgi:hypothetical protein